MEDYDCGYFFIFFVFRKYYTTVFMYLFVLSYVL